MAVITIRLPEETRQQLEQLAHTQNKTLSELARTALEALVRYPDNPYRSDEELSESMAPRSLSPFERQVLALQHRILAHVMPPEHADAPTEDCARTEGDPAYQRKQAQILEAGYVGEYPEVFISTDPELPAEESALAMDLLDMFRVIIFSIRQLRGAQIEVDPELERRLAFAGFDLQRTREARLLQYIRHLVSEDRWPELLPALDADNDYGNSHSMKLPSYQRLLTEYEAIRAERRPQLGLDGYLLSLGELQRLDAAQG